MLDITIHPIQIEDSCQKQVLYALSAFSPCTGADKPQKVPSTQTFEA